MSPSIMVQDCVIYVANEEQLEAVVDGVVVGACAPRGLLHGVGTEVVVVISEQPMLPCASVKQLFPRPEVIE